MSRTTSPGVVGPSFWSYMASVMAASLEREIDAGEIKVGDIPVEIHASALRFFRLVLGAAGNNIPANPPASFHTYVIATNSKFTA